MVRTSAALRQRILIVGAVIVAGTAVLASVCPNGKGSKAASEDSQYPWHTDIVATTFWVGEVFDPEAPDGSQVISTYDSKWMESYGGCDGVETAEGCMTEERIESNGYFPLNMTPLENPFYLDLPYDDINHPEAFANRGEVIPWAAADAAGNTDLLTDRKYSFMKNRWVRIKKGDRICYGQIQDAGPGQYNDAHYVFGDDDARPANKDFNGAGLDVSPALNGCLGFAYLNGQNDRVDWQFVDAEDVPDGPWKQIVTTRQVQ